MHPCIDEGEIYRSTVSSQISLSSAQGVILVIGTYIILGFRNHCVYRPTIKPTVHSLQGKFHLDRCSVECGNTETCIFTDFWNIGIYLSCNSCEIFVLWAVLVQQVKTDDLMPLHHWPGYIHTSSALIIKSIYTKAGFDWWLSACHSHISQATCQYCNAFEALGPYLYDLCKVYM